MDYLVGVAAGMRGQLIMPVANVLVTVVVTVLVTGKAVHHRHPKVVVV